MELLTWWQGSTLDKQLGQTLDQWKTLSQKMQKQPILCNVLVLLESLNASIVNLKDKYNSEEATKLLDPSISPEICVKIILNNKKVPAIHEN